MPGLLVHQGYRCPHYPYIIQNPNVTQQHHSQGYYKQDSSWALRRQSTAQQQARALTCLANQIINCQQFYHFSYRSHFFKVTSSLLLGKQGLVPVILL